MKPPPPTAVGAPSPASLRPPVRRQLLSLAAFAGLVLVLLGLTAPPGALRSSTPAGVDYQNFEGLQVHPITLTPDGTRLLAVNTPDARLEIFTVGPGSLTRAGEVRVGIEPVSVAALNDSIAWVVNHVSDDVSIVNLNTRHVVATVRVGDAPTDVVFAGTPRRGFVCVSGEDAVKAYGTGSLALELTAAVFGRHPRSLAVGAGGAEVYVAVLDAGNRTTILSANEVALGGGPPPPSPSIIDPALNPPPAVGLIVQWDGAHWVDERPASVKTWDSFIPYTLPDADVAVLDAATGATLRTVSDVGTNLFNIGVGPVSGSLFVTNTEAFNRTRFEPNLKGRFLRNRVTRVGPGGTAPVVPFHLNAHIVYDTIPGPPGEKALGLSQPVDIVVNATETKAYVAALGSDKIGVLDPTTGVVGNRIPTSVAPAVTRSGPTGLALDAARNQLFVLNRFANSIAIVDLGSETTVSETALRFDPSPPAILEGRRFLYDATLSEHGDLACASCHIGGNFDAIAWDLGDPRGSLAPVPPGNLAFGQFHPMKGPMTTQSLRGLPGTGPLHWRGDRSDFTRFNPAFVGLMGNEDTLTTADMARFRDFVTTMVYPPNPSQNLDRTYSDPPSGPSAARGLVEFRDMPHDGGQPCANAACHAFPAGTSGIIISRAALRESQDFKVPHIRNMYEKTGFGDVPGPTRRGFGFLHDGSIDNLLNFLRLPVFQFADDDVRRDVEAFLLSADTGLAPSVGRQLTIDGATKSLPATIALLDSLYGQADAGNCDLIAHGRVDGSNRSYVYRGAREFRSDYGPEGVLDADVLRVKAAAGGEITYLGVPPGAGMRMGVDRDRDGFEDRYEIALGSDEADPASLPYVTAASSSVPTVASRLDPNRPNPFNPTTVIPYEVGRGGRVRLHVFDPSGRLVRTLVDRVMPPGRYDARWDGRDDRGAALASGRYFYRLRIGEEIRTRSMTLLK